MACHGEEWYRKHGLTTVTVTPKDNVTAVSLRRETIPRDGGATTSETFNTAALAAGVSWGLAAGTIYNLFLTIVQGDSAKAASARVKIQVRDQVLVDNDCSSSGEGISGDWRIIVFRESAS